jgi:hypothetical protein
LVSAVCGIQVGEVRWRVAEARHAYHTGRDGTHHAGPAGGKHQKDRDKRRVLQFGTEVITSADEGSPKPALLAHRLGHPPFRSCSMCCDAFPRRIAAGR